MPLKWSEVKSSLDSQRCTMLTVGGVLRKTNPWQDYCDGERPLKQAIERLVKLSCPARCFCDEEPERNDRVIAVPRDSHREKSEDDARDLSKQIRQEIEKFFVATDELEAKELQFLGWKGPRQVKSSWDQAVKGFSRDAAPESARRRQAGQK
jgi:inorganic pyrophosphatase